MSKSTIISKAMRCIDEVTAGADAPLEEGLFPTDVFFNEALRWVIDVVPLRQLGEGEMLVLCSLDVSADGVGRGVLPDDFARLISFKANDWVRPVVTPIYDTDAQYLQQSNRVLRGKPSRPIVAICKGKTILEYYTTKTGDLYTAQYIPYDVTSIPPHLEDMVAWKLAEIVLLSISDANAAAVCSARVKDILTEMTV